MRKITNIDIGKSIQTRKLIFTEDLSDKLDRCVVYFISSCFIVYPVLTFPILNIQNRNDTFLLFTLFPISILFGAYLFFRKATEKRLSKLGPPFDKEENIRELLEFANARQYEIHRKSNGCLIFNEPVELQPGKMKSIVILVSDHQILFTVLKEQYRLNVPTLTAHLFLRRDLQKLFKA